MPAKPQSGRAIELGLALRIVSKRGRQVMFGQTGLLFANRQWVYDTQNSDTLKGEYTINIPISMNLLGCATSGTRDDATNIVGWSTTSITVKTFQSHKTDTTYQVRRPFHAILIGK